MNCKAPSKKVHRGFLYLDDETVIHSLSAVESCKIDEVVAKVNSARDGGFGGGAGFQGAKVEGCEEVDIGLRRRDGADPHQVFGLRALVSEPFGRQIPWKFRRVGS